MSSVQPRPEIAELLHERRFTRFLCLTRDVPRIKGRCAWCGGPGRKGLKYCCEACSNEANIRASGAVVQALVFRRDRGVCAVCGMDCHWLQSKSLEIVMAGKRMPYGSVRGLPGSWGPWTTDLHYSLWEADHVIPVCEGGGVCGLENYRTLCLRCHKAESTELARRRAQGAC